MKTILPLCLCGACLFFAASLAAQRQPVTDLALRVTQWNGATVLLTAVDVREKTRRSVVVDVQKGTFISDETTPLTEQEQPKTALDNAVATLTGAVNPTFSPDSTRVAFTRGNNLYTVRLSDNQETQLTFDGSDVILNGYASWVYMEEILGRAGRYRAFWWSPDSRRLAFYRADDSQTPLFAVTDSPKKNGYMETWRYPKAGDSIPQVTVGIVPADGGAITWADADDTESHYLGLPYWRPDGQALWLQWLNHGQNHYKLLEIDGASGASKELYGERQKTWISLDDEPRIRFLESGKGFIFASDKSGWNHLYLHDMNGKPLHAITAGSYTVLDVVAVDEKEKTVYFTCYKDHPGARDFYKAGLYGKRLQRLSFGDYSHSVSLSADKKYFVTTYSNVDTPPQVALYSTSGKFIGAIQDTKNNNFDVYERPQTVFVALQSDDGKYKIPMRITLPMNRQEGKKYPVYLSVYGGPGAMQARNEWRDAGDEAYAYAHDGLLQVTLDHRGSGHNGKTGQEEMYRRLGYWEIKDYSQAVQWLIANQQANPEKILISGFSYGGYIVCYALTYGADVFTHGMAGGSVVDWQLYDAIYTERYMDTPAENPDGYAASSVLTHAGKLKGKLLLTHGLRDENVHAQNTFQLISVLEDLQKDFELMIYPESRHGYRNAKREHSRRMEREFIDRYLLEK